MIFLKKFYAFGFKSFADEINIDFTDEMTGIVGPNGAGKSNIVDAFKWVLGEQSVKDMRGDSKFDLIFKGSATKPEAKFSQVSMTFNNSSRVLHYDKDEITITRKLYRDTGNNDYFINNEPARLKDIQMIFTDTGLSKGSLGIISQGTVNSFSEAKPENRRKMFEDAAGIGMYSIQKEEALRHLERTEQALESIMAFERELDKDLKKLLKQAETAKIYAEKHDKLKEIEITILVRDISHYSKYLTQLETEINNLINEKQKVEPQENEFKSKLEFIRQKQKEADDDNTKFNQEMFNINEKISNLEKKHLLMTNKLESDLSSSNEQTKINAYEQLINACMVDMQSLKERISELQTQITAYQDISGSLSMKKNDFYEKINTKNIELTENWTKLRMINEQINRKTNLSSGIKAILENKSAVSGIYDVVAKYIDVEAKYELAISKALGKAVDNIIVESSENAKNAIKFLKNNNAGKATFLPLKDIKAKVIRNEHLDVLDELEGFVGVASRLVNVEDKMIPIIEALIGQVIIATDIDAAVRISKYTSQLYKVITLDGDIVYAGGALTGGSENGFVSQFNLEKHRDELQAVVDSLETELTTLKVEHEKIMAELNESETKLNEKKFTLNNLSNNLENITKNYEKYKNEYEVLTKKSFDDNKVFTENDIQNEINHLMSLKDKISENLNVSIANKYNYTSQANELEGQLEDVRLRYDRVKDELNKAEQDALKCKNILDTARVRINETYQMTLEFAIENYNKELPMSEAQAREVINQLKADIDALGVINHAAIEELEEKQAKFEKITASRKETEESLENIRISITELDKAAKAKFAKLIDDVNAILPDIFKFLFGGGSCAVTFSDPSNILESGIEVMAHPPGKRVSNLKLLSGGEKTLVAISVLFAILKISSFPIVILDEAEAALDIANVERFAQIIRQYSKNTQFLVITHRPGTMKECKTLLGATMQTPGVTSIISVSLESAIELSEKE